MPKLDNCTLSVTDYVAEAVDQFASYNICMLYGTVTVRSLEEASMICSPPFPWIMRELS